MWKLDEAAVLKAEELAVSGSPRLMESLRRIPLDSFAELLLRMPDSALPGLSSRLPSMAPDEVQQTWTGAKGWPLLHQTLCFVRLVNCAAVQFTGSGIANKTILDFGCGWGRMLRLLPWFTSASLIYGCDPWDRSLAICQEHKVWGQLALSEYLPDTLPFGDTRFEVVIAFSVFTHTSARALRAALVAIRQRISHGGLLVVTIRPIEYWQMAANSDKGVDAGAMEHTHLRSGIAFRPHKRPPMDGDVTYGDTSMTLEYLGSCDGWRVAGYDWLLGDPYQVPVFLVPA